MKKNTIIGWAAAFGMIAVIFGALGAHALSAKLEPQSLSSFKTAVTYQTSHALALLILGMGTFHVRFLKSIVSCWIVGTFLFSGSIYLLSTSSLTGINWSFLGPVTPVGGLLFITGWLLILLSVILPGRSERSENTE